MRKVLITGATGYLAGALIPVAKNYGNVTGLARNAADLPDDVDAISLDILDASGIADVCTAEKPDVIIHAAASNPGSDESAMQRINEFGAKHIAEAAVKVGARLVVVSSDTVHDGVSAPFADNAVANPLPDFLYGQSKAAAERAVTLCYPDAIIVRTSLIYGIERIDRGTASFVSRLNAGEPVKLFHDVIRQPVHDIALSECLCKLGFEYENEHGTINIAGNQALSRLEFGQRMLDFWQIDGRDQVEAVSGASFPGLPLDLRLNLDRAHALGLATPGVDEVIL